jgi:hypothetical protein
MTSGNARGERVRGATDNADGHTLARVMPAWRGGSLLPRPSTFRLCDRLPAELLFAFVKGAL